MTHGSPLVKLAMPRFTDDFRDLLGVRANVSPFDRTILEGIYEDVLWFGRPRRDHDNLRKTARATYSFINRGSLKKFDAVAQQFLKVVNEIIPALNVSLGARGSAEGVSEDDPDAQIRAYLEYYKTMYEGLLPLILAPVVYGLAIAKGINKTETRPGEDGKIRLKALKVVEGWPDFPESRLSRGLNGHVRNAYAHELYTIMDDAKVKLVDKNPRTGKITWGPEVWELSRLVRLCEELWVNALGIICGLVLFQINNQLTMRGRGMTAPAISQPLRREELKTAISSVSEELGFRLKEVEVTSGRVAITLSAEPKGIDQDEKLCLGYKDSVQLHIQPVKYVEKSVIDQVIAVLCRLQLYFESGTELHVTVESPDGEMLGEVVADCNTLRSILTRGARPPSIDEIRRVLKGNTVGDSTTYVRVEEALRRV